MMTADVVAFSSGSMTEAVYLQERAAIRATYGDGSSRQARAAADQALAALFARSGWTQERLAQIEGQPRQVVARRLLFGQFLANAPNGANAEFDLVRPKLTEGKFRDYWKRTTDIGNTRARYTAIQRLVLDDVRIEGSRMRKHPIIPATIVRLADGHRHKESTIIAAAQEAGTKADPPVTIAADDVQAVLAGMCGKRTHGVVVEKEKGVKECKYKITKAGRQIDLDAFMLEAGPILKGLKAEGEKNMATMSPGTVARLTFLLEELLQKWTRMSAAPSSGSSHKE